MSATSQNHKGHPKPEDENFVINFIITQPDRLKFLKECTELYESIYPENILTKSINVSNVQTQQGVMCIFNCYMEVLTDEACYKEWLLDIKVKNKLITG